MLNDRVHEPTTKEDRGTLPSALRI